MDFVTVVQIGATLSLAVLAVSLTVFLRRVATVRGKVTSTTFRALIFFGISSFMIGVIVVVAAFTNDLTAQRVPITIFVVTAMASIAHIATDDRRVHHAMYVTAMVLLLAAVTVPLYLPPHTTRQLMFFSLFVSFIMVMILSIWVFWSSPSPFTGSLVALGTSFIVVWGVIATVGIAGNMELMPVIFIPIAIASAVLASILKPWRMILTLFTAVYAVVNLVSLGVNALMSSEFFTFGFVAAAAIAALATIVSIDFFAEQATSTQAVVPTYVTVSLIAVSMLFVIHSMEWAFAYPLLTLWTFIWAEWILANVTIASFMLAGLATFMSKSIRHARRIVLAITTTLIVLGSDFASAGRWTVEALIPFVLAELAIGVYAYVRTARRLRNLGAKRAASHFLAFMSSIVLGALVVLVSFEIPPVLTMGLFVMIALALTQSSPRKPKLLGRTH
ncbi:MAG: hypothetical protein ACTSPE_06860 [Candidatus Thorarchaeota archaeon]